MFWKEEVWIDGICKQNGDSSEDERELRAVSGEIKEVLVTLKRVFI